MYAARYFAPRYFAPRYWPSVGAELPDIVAPDAEGIEWTLPASRLHYAISADLPHWTMPSEGSS